jgi:serine/threonine protein kinase
VAPDPRRDAHRGAGLTGKQLMSDTASESRNVGPSPSPGETESLHPVVNNQGAGDNHGSGAVVRKATRPPVGDQPTIITSAPPIPSPATGDSAGGILGGGLMPGDRIGQFELVEYVGGGGMGRVFRAIDTRLGRTVALKILPPEQATGADAAQRFQNEAQSAARLDHDNIARAYYVGEDRGLSYIVFEFVEGVNVRLLVEQKGPLPLAEALNYTLQITEALAHADSRGVVHRDIKPSNVLITPDGRVKLIDMGLARLRNVDASGGDLTQSGVTLGTFDYISPEQARDPRKADIRSDIYSLGCTLFFMLVGRPPFPEGTVLQKLLQHQGDQPPEVREFRPDLPEELSRTLRKMMAKDPRQRYAGSAELAADLLALADQIGLRPVSPTSRVWVTPTVRPEPLLRRHLPWIAPAAALICIVLALDHWSAPRDEPAPPSLVPTAQQQKAVVAPPPSKKGSQPAKTSAAEKAAPNRPGVLVVGQGAAGRSAFASLGAACAAARDGDTIELRFNGPREERPIRIPNLRLTIRAGEGFRPVVVFRPTESDPIKHPRSMFTLTAGRLTMIDAAVELDVPRDVAADKWSLIETCGGQTVRLERCALAVRNASEPWRSYHPDVAFVRARPAPDADATLGTVSAATPLATIELADCVARGEASLLSVEELQPVSLSWDNGLLVTSEPLLAAGGGLAAPRSDDMARIELRHLTAVVRGGLCRLSATASNPHQLAVQFACTDNIIFTGPGVPLVEQDGPGAVQKMRERFVWNGDRNFYQDTDVFWLVRSVDPQIAPESMTFEGWRAHWGASREEQPSCEPLHWKQSPPTDRPLHSHMPADYALEDPTFGDAATGAPGVRADRLLPLESVPRGEASNPEEM